MNKYFTLVMIQTYQKKKKKRESHKYKIKISLINSNIFSQTHFEKGNKIKLKKKRNS